MRTQGGASVRKGASSSWLLQFYALAVAPTPPGDGQGPKKAAPLPSVWGGLLLVDSCEVAGGPRNILDWRAFPRTAGVPRCFRHVPLVSSTWEGS